MSKVGKVRAYVGTMGAGKTKKLISIYNKLREKGNNVFVFKHVNDFKRSGFIDKIVARNGESAPAITIESLYEIVEYKKQKPDAILIDEIQFFNDEDTIDIIEMLATLGIDVYVFGLDVTSDFETFGLVGEILALADEVEKLKCKCYLCGAPARVSAYIGKEEKHGDVKIGDLDEYIPLCRVCFYKNIELENEDEEDKLHEFDLSGDGYRLRISVYESELREAGYTPEQVRDINSAEGIFNLLEDLGYKMGEIGYE